MNTGVGETPHTNKSDLERITAMSTATIKTSHVAPVVEGEAAPTVEPTVEVKAAPKPSLADLKAGAEESINEAFEDLTTALSQSGAGVAAAESSAVAFVQGIAALRKAKVTQTKVVDRLTAQAAKAGVEGKVPFASAGYVVIAEIVGALLDKGDELGTVTRVRKDEAGKNEKFEAGVVVRVDGFGGTNTGPEEVEIFGIVRAVVSPQGVPFLTAAGVSADEYGKDAAIKLVNEAADVNEAVRALDHRAQVLKSNITKGKKVTKDETAAKAAKEVTGDALILALAAANNKFLQGLTNITPENGDPVAVSQDSIDVLNTVIASLQAVIDAKAIEVVAAAAAPAV
jgi:hypothetical protein